MTSASISARIPADNGTSMPNTPARSTPRQRSVRVVLVRWGSGVLLVGTVVPILMVTIAVGLSEQRHQPVSAALLFGRGELFLLAAVSVLSSLVTAAEPDSGGVAPVPSSLNTIAIVFIVMPCFSVWAHGTAMAIVQPDLPALDDTVSVGLGEVALLVSLLVALAVHVRVAWFQNVLPTRSGPP